jgi:hypothetical protein
MNKFGSRWANLNRDEVAAIVKEQKVSAAKAFQLSRLRAGRQSMRMTS